MSCSTAVANEVCRRFEQYTNWKFMDDEGKLAVCRAIMEAAKTDKHARLMVDQWCRSRTDAPVEAQVYELAQTVAVPDGSHGIRPDYKCAGCLGCGYKWAYALIDYRNGRRQAERISAVEYADLETKVDGKAGAGQIVARGVEWCDCGYGRHLREVRLARAAMDDDVAEGGKKRRVA